MKRKGMSLIIAIILLIWFGGRKLIELLVDWNWFDAVDHAELFTTRIWTQFCLALLFFVATACFIGFNLRYLLKSKPFPFRVIKEQLVEGSLKEEQVRTFLKYIAYALVFLPALLMAGIATQQWLYALAFFDSVSFGKVDPFFQNDLSFYIFEFPILRFALGAAISMSILTLLIVSALTAIRDVFLGQGAVKIHEKAIRQVIVLLMFLLSLFGLSWFFDRYDLLFSKNGVVWGIGYTDANARVPAYMIMAVLSWLSVPVLFIALKRKKYRIPIAVGVVYVIARVLLTNAWPSLIQNLMVEPSELEKETAYL